MKVLVVGGGGREHALAWSLSRSASVSEIIAAPGNPGIARLGRCIPISIDHTEELVALARTQEVHLVVIGPEAPLSRGLADELRFHGIPTMGPGAVSAQLETSKAFARSFMLRHKLPIPGYALAHNAESAEAAAHKLGYHCVVKYDGLAAGKGVFVCADEESVQNAIKTIYIDRAFGEKGEQVALVEELLIGSELSVLALVSNQHYALLPPSRDHKRAYDGDEGPNTGGMGAYSPVPDATPEVMKRVEEEIVKPTVQGLMSDGFDYRGILYFGLMLTKSGPKVLEFNVRMGDPETQVVLPRLDCDLGELMLACARGENLPTPVVRPDAAVTVVMASEGYPGAITKGFDIYGVEKAETEGALVFQAGVIKKDSKLVTAGGRVLAVTALGPDLMTAHNNAYRSVSHIKFAGAFYRYDIARFA